MSSEPESIAEPARDHDEAGAPAAPVPLERVAVLVATAGGVGFGPWAPGTWGALVAVLGFVALAPRTGPFAFAVVLLLVTLVGCWASGRSERYFGKHDDGRIVIDEVAGQLITLAPLLGLAGRPLGRLGLPSAWLGPDSVLSSGFDIWWLLVVTAFVAFRWFDIRKPGPVRWAEERFGGGLGVMADDIVAGLLGAGVVMVPAYIALLASLSSSGGAAS